MDRISSKRRSDNMRAIRSKGTKPEMVVRRLVHQMGYRYRLHSDKLPGKPDLVFPSRRKVILVHGCFWHQHDDPSCNICRMPLSNIEYWQSKLTRNKERDRLELKSIEQLGWSTLVLWECEIDRRTNLEEQIRRFLN